MSTFSSHRINQRYFSYPVILKIVRHDFSKKKIVRRDRQKKRGEARLIGNWFLVNNVEFIQFFLCFSSGNKEKNTNK